MTSDTNSTEIEPMVRESQAQLEPLFQDLIDLLDQDGNAYPMAFFTQMLICLRTNRTEAEVLQLFFDLSSTAFQGFSFTPAQALSVDQLLARCEAIAFAMTANENSAH